MNAKREGKYHRDGVCVYEALFLVKLAVGKSSLELKVKGSLHALFCKETVAPFDSL